MTYRLEPDETLADGLRRVVIEQAAAAAERLAEEAEPALAVHEARKRGKEARAALRLLRGSLGDEAERALRAHFRDAARRIAAARDAEASLLTFEKLRHHQRLLRKERLPVEEALRAARDAAAAEVTAAVRAEVAATFAEAGARIPVVPYAGALTVAQALERSYRRGRRAMRASAETGHDDDYHRWRQETKDLWYAVRLFEGAWPGPLGALAGELHALSQVLGEDHDLAVLRALIGASDPSLLTPRLARAIGRRQKNLRTRAHAAGARLWAEKPGDFAGRILGYWESWRERGSG